MGNRIKGLVEERGFTQKYVALAVGLSEQVFSNKLNGLRNFSLKDLTALADVLAVSVDYLTGRTDHGEAE